LEENAMGHYSHLFPEVNMMNYDTQNERNSKQLLLPNFGEPAQQKLANAKVLVIGAGSLGSPVLQYLAASGIGQIGIADAAEISLSNLQRQVLYTTADIGQFKCTVAAERLRKMNPDIVIYEHLLFIDNKNALPLFKDYDVVIDGTDNFTARYLINDACVLLEKPLIFGAVFQYEGQVAIFNVKDKNGIKVNYRHLFPTPPTATESQDFGTSGVPGMLPGTIGIIQAAETIKLITGIGTPLINKMVAYRALTNESSIVKLSMRDRAEINMPRNEDEFRNMDYTLFCNPAFKKIHSIGGIEFRRYLNDESTAIIDVREIGERPLATFRHSHIPLSVFRERLAEIQSPKVVLFCQSGTRSIKAAEILAEHFKTEKMIYTLDRGILSL